MRVLLHACCGPCAIYPVDALRAEGLDLSLYFHNPNIQPYQEFERRREAAKMLAEQRGLPVIVDDDYDPETWLRMVAFRESVRCTLCYRERLSAAARAARRGGFDAFTTSILYSKSQKHGRAREQAEAAGEEEGVAFLYRDFRAGWKAGIEESKRMGMYRQQYCGCIFSERDRFRGVPRPAGEGH